MYDYTRRDMIEALKMAGLEKGDLVLFYVSLAMLGMGEGITSQETMNQLFLDCVREVLGEEGTMFVPTYSYSLCKGEVYDSATTPGTIGAFPEYFRQRPGVIRSEEPILPVAGLGPAAEDVFRDLPPTSYGHGCVYDRLARRGAKICTVGLRLNWATFRHFIEEIYEVPFRYRKVFTGPVLRNGREEIVSWTYSVRLWGENAMPDGVRLADMAVADGVTTTVQLGRNTIFCIGAKDYVEYAGKKLKDDPWLTAAGPAADPIALEEARVPVVSYGLGRDPQASPADLAAAIGPLPRVIMSDAYNESLFVLAERFGMRILGYPSGTEGEGCLVPEKWTCHGASLADADGNTIFALSQSPLRLAAYSGSFSGQVSGDEVRKRCKAHDAIAAISSMERRFWCWSCTNEELAALSDDAYFVDVRADFSYGNLNMGELVIEGANGEVITLVSFLDDPCQFDAGLSGVLAGCLAMERLARRGTSPRSVRLLVLPRTYGLSVWGAKNPEDVASTGEFILLDHCARGEVSLAECPSGAERELAREWGVPIRGIGSSRPYPAEGTAEDTVNASGLSAIERAAEFLASYCGGPR